METLLLSITDTAKKDSEKLWTIPIFEFCYHEINSTLYLEHMTSNVSFHILFHVCKSKKKKSRIKVGIICFLSPL